MKNKLSLLFTILAINYIYSQQNNNQYDYYKNYNNTERITQKPSDWSFKDYSKDGTVDVSTGKFGLSLPVWIIKDQDMELPIGLSYSTSGVKLDQNSSEVGLNWELFAGGSIIRKVNGVRDEIQEATSPSGGTTLVEYAGNAVPTNTNGGILGSGTNVFTTTLMKTGSMYFVNSFYNMSTYNEKFPRIHSDNYYSGMPVNITPPALENIPQSVYEINRAQYSKEYQRDIFKFSVGDFSFNFALIDENPNDPFTGQIALPLDEKGIKIEFEKKFAPTTSLYNVCENCQETSIFTKFIVTDKKGVKYYFEEYEIVENEYVYDYYRFPVDPTVDSSPWLLIRDEAISAQFRKKIFQHLMKSANVDRWYLTKIEYPSGKKINLTYTTDKYAEFFVQQRKHDGEYLGNSNNTVPKYNAGYFDKMRSYTRKKYINSIFAEDFNTKIYFNYTSYRPDYITGGKNLDNIRVMDNHNSIIKQIVLEKEFSNAEIEENSQDYRMFLSSFKEMKITDKSNYNNNNIVDNQYSFLYNSINLLPQKNFLPYTDLFGYYLGNRGAATVLSNLAFPKLFLYPDETDGNRISYEPYSQTAVETNGVDRRPIRADGPSEGSLSEIIFPTKGNLKITYEANTYFFDKGLNKNPYGPGIRVKKLVHDNNNNNQTIKEYYYNKFTDNHSSGNLLYKPSFAYISNHVANNQINQDNSLNSSPQDFMNFYRFNIFTTARELEIQGLDSNSIIKKMVVLSNQNLGPQSDIFGREILYTNVTEKTINSKNNTESYSKKFYNFYEDNSTEVNAISGPTDEPTYISPGNKYLHHIDKVTDIYMPWNDSYTSINYKMSYGFVEKKGKNIFPFPDRNYFDMNNELLNGKNIKTEYLNSAGNIVSEENFVYEPLITIDKALHLLRNRNFQVSSVATHVFNATDPLKRSVELDSSVPTYSRMYHHFERYRRAIIFFTDTNQYFQRPLRLKTSKRKLYFQSGESVEEITNYEYSPYQYALSLQKNLSSDGNIYETKFKYINDISSGNNDYVAFGLTGIPLIIEKFKNNKQISKSLITYGRDWIGHEHMRLSKVEDIKINTINGNEEIINQRKITQYDDKGNILEYSTEEGIPVTMIWGYNKTLPIAKIEGATYSLVSQYVSDIIAKSNNDTDTSSEQILIDALDAFRKNTAFVNYQITTYTYDPLVGITTTTSPSGMRETYQYDKLGRLEKIIDVDGKLIKEMKYNFKQ